MYYPPSPHGQYGRFMPAGVARPNAVLPISVPSTAAPPNAAWPSAHPAGQAVTSSPTDACPVCAHCPSLPSSDSAYEAISGAPGGWISVVGTTLLRAVLVGAGIATYDAIAKHKNPHIIPQAIAGAVGIEIFVLGWTWLKSPKA